MAYDLLADVKVVEVSMYAFAPASAAVLADWGAEVIKIVPPTAADPMLGKNVIGGLPDKDVGVAFMWEQMNRGKQCLCLDLSTADGHAILMDLLRQTDVFITNLLPGARTRFRIDTDDVLAVNPKIIYARASGHGAKGPQSDTGGFDHTDYWARTGIGHAASMVAGEFIPQVGPAMGDLSAGAFLAGGIAAALFRRERTGRGGVVDVSLLSSGAWAFAPGIIASQLYGVDTIPRRRHLDLPNPLMAGYKTRDDRIIYFAGLQTDKHFTAFAGVIGRADMLDDPRFATGDARLANASACIAELDKAFAQHDLLDWTERFRDSPTPWAVVQTAAEAATDPQTVANGYVITIQGEGRDYPLVASPAQFDETLPTAERAPAHGEHTELILMDLGIDWDKIASLKQQGVIN